MEGRTWFGSKVQTKLDQRKRIKSFLIKERQQFTFYFILLLDRSMVSDSFWYIYLAAEQTRDRKNFLILTIREKCNDTVRWVQFQLLEAASRRRQLCHRLVIRFQDCVCHRRFCCHDLQTREQNRTRDNFFFFLT